jgi:hypothetical protein
MNGRLYPEGAATTPILVGCSEYTQFVDGMTASRMPLQHLALMQTVDFAV